MERRIFLRLRHRVKAHTGDIITIGDAAQIAGQQKLKKKLSALPLYKVTKKDKNIVVLDIIKVLKIIHTAFPALDVQTVGGAETIVEIHYQKKQLSAVLFVGVWLLLFIGSCLAIMNFHEDVSMREVHIALYEIITGERNEYPYLLQIPYSIGLGLGMIVFFNHIFKKRLNEEPSPLEVEMFNYQLDLDHYVAMHENEETMKDLHDR
ncbi:MULTISPECIES: stage V sporulation protein AA [Bacillus amyloliquefaciens group]|uniref:stage V sporulation protein AA n=1 Tax=Bacillus amyloliquefaciens group TaxID=1938374 RepID=UPI0020A07C57|nr:MULTISPECIES: stage V sporulation protein AA [Bacillus amyloliquefaciens group]MCP1459808.1 stage V sporulation protein AA [Bacillus amyloliquefaciens]WHY37114.1 stage V sporulation protein AA [Bacillus velezensis]